MATIIVIEPMANYNSKFRTVMANYNSTRTVMANYTVPGTVTEL
jgi:hypothetical protein